jgi:hypothetical protein
MGGIVMCIAAKSERKEREFKAPQNKLATAQQFAEGVLLRGHELMAMFVQI